MKNLAIRLRRVSTGWITLLGLVVFTLFTALVLPRQAAQAEESSGGADTPDLSFTYSANELYEMAEAYGEQGRDDYVRIRLPFDLVWPLVYGFFLVTALSWLFKRALPAASPWQRANLTPLLGMLFDYLENISTSLVMVRYPETTFPVDYLATVFTPVKWVFVYLSFGLLVIGLVMTIWKRLRGW